MNDQLKIIIQSILTYGGGLLTAKGYTDGSTMETIVAGALALIGAVWHWWHHSEATAQNPPLSQKGH